MGLGSLVYALSKLDGSLQREEIQTVRELFASDPHADLVIYAYFIRENTGESVDEAYAFGMRRLMAQRVELNEQTKKRFVSILRRVARAHEGISRQERAFIRRFWHEIRHL
ncbi:tellurite resistance TerB family protein [Spirosoma taeanense]|nr:TerB family tellurite resistance protein [Spirosoma taeanense]